MPLIPIDSIDDARVRVYQDLPQKKNLEKQGLFIVEGKYVVQRLIQSPLMIESILVSADRAEEIAALAGDDVPIYQAARPLLDSIVGFHFHRGMLACGRRPLAANVPWNLFRKPSRRSLVVACVNVNDPENLGGILRNCAAFGVDLLVLTEDCTDPYSRRVLRVSMATALELPIVTSDQATELVSRLQADFDFRVVGSVLGGKSRLLAEVSPVPRAVIVVGNEADGIGEQWERLCDHQVKIPMCQQVDSLNVSVATGILLYHFREIGKTDSHDSTNLRAADEVAGETASLVD